MRKDDGTAAAWCAALWPPRGQHGNVAELLTRPLLRRDEPAWGSRVPWLAALLSAAWSLVAGLAICVLPTVAWWLTEGASASVASPLRFGSWAWLVSHRVNVIPSDGSFGLPPLALTLLFLFLLYRSGRWAAHTAAVSTPRDAATVIASLAGSYAVGGALLAAASTTSAVTVAAPEAAAWAAFWALVAAGGGVLHESGVFDDQLSRLTPESRIAFHVGVRAVGVMVAVGAGLLLVSAVGNAGNMGSITSALDAGLFGTALLIILSLVYLPNAAIWASAFALGPGFAVGVGTTVSPSGIDLGLVPALPLLGALPSSVSAVAWMALALPIAVGALMGVAIHRRLPDAPIATAGFTAAGAAGVVMMGMALLAMLSAGSAGGGRLAEVGAASGPVAVTTLALVGVPAVAAAVFSNWRTDGAASIVTSQYAPEKVEED